MPTGTYVQVVEATTLDALVTAVDAVITADPTWVIDGGGVVFNKQTRMWSQGLKKVGS